MRDGEGGKTDRRRAQGASSSTRASRRGSRVPTLYVLRSGRPIRDERSKQDGSSYEQDNAHIAKGSRRTRQQLGRISRARPAIVGDGREEAMRFEPARARRVDSSNSRRTRVLSPALIPILTGLHQYAYIRPYRRPSIPHEYCMQITARFPTQARSEHGCVGRCKVGKLIASTLRSRTRADQPPGSNPERAHPAHLLSHALILHPSQLRRRRSSYVYLRLL